MSKLTLVVVAWAIAGGCASAASAGTACTNPSGHERGWCKHARGNAYTAPASAAQSAVTGMVLAVNGDLARFREDSGETVTVDQRALLGSYAGLHVGAHYTLRGYWTDGVFVARSSGGNTNANGYPRGGGVSVEGVITSISGARVTLMQGIFSSITVDDQQALNRGAAQNLFVGRSVTAYGFWSGPVFYATSIG